MNRPCRIHFHSDAAPRPEQLPERYQHNVEGAALGSPISTLLVQNAFFIDFAPGILRTRVGGVKEEDRVDPVDFPVESVAFIEWFYGDTPSPLRPWEPRSDRPSTNRTQR